MSSTIYTKLDAITLVKKPDLARKLINQTLERKYRPGIVLIDGGYGNNSTFLQELERLKLKYIGGLAKNRLGTVINPNTGEKQTEKRLDEIILFFEWIQKNLEVFAAHKAERGFVWG